MKALVEQKTGWAYAWRNSGTKSAPAFTAFFAHPNVKTNILYSYESLLEVLNDHSAASQIPKHILQKMLREYPTQYQRMKKAAA